MTVPSTARRAGPFTGTGALVSYPFTFRVFTGADIAVTTADTDGVETIGVLDSDFLVTLNADQDATPGGSVRYAVAGVATALPANYVLAITGNRDYAQEADLPQGGAFNARAVEDALDSLEMQIQQIRDSVSRAVQLSVLSPIGTEVMLPIPLAAAVIGWNGDGTGLQNYSPDTSISTDLLEARLAATTTNNGAYMIGARRSEAGSVASTLRVAYQDGVVLPTAHFAAAGNGTTDDSTAIAAALATGKVVDLGGRTYRIVTKLVASVAGTVLMNGTLLFDGANTTRLLDITASNVTMFNVTCDGNDKQPRASLVRVEGNVARPRLYYCTIKDVYGTAYGSDVLNQTCGLNVDPYAVTDFEIVGCRFENIKKVNDGTLIAQAIGLGFAGGIYFLPEGLNDPSAAQPTPSRGIVQGCAFNTIQTVLAGSLTTNQVADYDDGDGIRTYAGTGAKKLDVLVSDCTFTACSKRAIKFRASGGKAHNCKVYTAGNAYGMSTVVDVVHDCIVDNFEVYASSALPVIKVATASIGGNATNSLCAVRNVWASHCVTGVEFIAVAAATLENFTFDNIELPYCTTAGIIENVASQAATQRNLTVRRIRVNGSGNNCQGMLLSLGADNTGGWKVRDIVLVNADCKIEGINNDVRNHTISITSSSYAGSAAGRALFEFGSGKGLGGFNKTEEIIFDLTGINTGYVSATRPYLVLFNTDKSELRGYSCEVPEGLSVTYPHFEGVGDDAVIDGFVYTGPGYCRWGHLVASSRWAVKNAVRRGNGACTQPFWTLNAASQFYEFENITDFRPTNATTITSVTATNGIATNVKTRSTAGTPAASGVAKTANLNTF